MKKVNVKEQVWIIGEKGFDKDDRRIITYYLETPDRERMYAFKQSYSHSTYDLCKTGIRVNALVCMKTSNPVVMKLVDRTKKMMPYLAEYYELNKAC